MKFHSAFDLNITIYADRAFADEYSETVSLMDSAAENVEEYHSTLIATREEIID